MAPVEFSGGLPVVVVGAGPTGMTIAYLLAKRNVNVILIESAATFDRVFRGEGLMPGGMAALAQMGLLEVLRQLPTQQIHTWAFSVDDRPIVCVDEPAELGEYRPTIVPQSQFLQAVLERAKALPSFQFQRGIVSALTWDADRVTGVVLRQGERSQAIPAALVIGCDGRSSSLRRLADLPFHSRPYDADVLWFRLDAPLPVAQRSTFYGFIRGADSLGAYSAGDGSLKLAYLLDRQRSKPEIAPQKIDWAGRLATIAPNWLAQHLRENADRLADPIKLNVVFGYCPQWFRSGLLLLGDAAHPMAPIRAQGINVALRDVLVAVNHLLPGLQSNDLNAIDAALPLIQAARLPEIKRAQRLQAAEQRQATLLNRSPIVRQLLTTISPLARPLITQRWQAQQQILRFGLAPIELE